MIFFLVVLEGGVTLASFNFLDFSLLAIPGTTLVMSSLSGNSSTLTTFSAFLSSASLEVIASCSTFSSASCSIFSYSTTFRAEVESFSSYLSATSFLKVDDLATSLLGLFLLSAGGGIRERGV